MLVEPAIVVAGAYLYWRAACAIAESSSVSVQRRAHLAGLLALVCGIAVLAIDFTGVFG